MKKYSLIVMIFLFTQSNAFSKLRNGYEKEMQQAREKMKRYDVMMNTYHQLSVAERKSIKANIKDLIEIQSYYELTEKLLAQFKLISPGLYNQMDSIKDAKGRPTDVYVKFIPHESALVMARGITSMARSDEDRDACFSEYGKHTVSIKIWIFNHALFVLSHEFGHVHYQVPNLAHYTEYYKQIYQPYKTESNHMGHAANDRSGRNALHFEKAFKKDYFNYLKSGNNNHPLESPWVLAEDIRKRASNAPVVTEKIAPQTVRFMRAMSPVIERTPGRVKKARSD